MRILIVGGYGTFGGRLVRLLADDARLTVLVAGRSLEKAQSLCADIDAKAKLVPTAFDRARDARQQIATLKSDILVDASGPFQIYGDNPYALVEACLAQRVHYIDLADAPDFVDGIAGFDAEASDAGIAILSGASTTPVLTTDVMRKLAQGIAPRTITAGIAPSPHSEIGLSVVRAAASYAGKPLTIRRNGCTSKATALVDSRRYTIAPPGTDSIATHPLLAGRYAGPDLRAAALARRVFNMAWCRTEASFVASRA